MRLVASTPNSKPVPESIRDRLVAISQDDLRAVVERICALRPTGTPVADTFFLISQDSFVINSSFFLLQPLIEQPTSTCAMRDQPP
jgi:hypothetical protein